MAMKFSDKRQNEEMYRSHFSDAVTRYCDYLRALNQAEKIKKASRDISYNNYSALWDLSKVVEDWFAKNIHPNTLMKIAGDFRLPKDEHKSGGPYLINELYLANKRYNQYTGLIPLTPEEFNDPVIYQAFNNYKNSLKVDDNDSAYAKQQAFANAELDKFKEYSKMVLSAYGNTLWRPFIDEVKEQAQEIVKNEVKNNE